MSSSVDKKPTLAVVPGWEIGFSITQGNEKKNYTHPCDIVPIITLAELNDKKKFPTPETHFALGDGVTRKADLLLSKSTHTKWRTLNYNTTDWAQPMYIGPLYWNVAFPDHNSSGKDKPIYGSVRTGVDADNIWNGRVVGMTTLSADTQNEKVYDILESDFAWYGYYSRFYDGDLYLTALSRKSFVEGIATRGYFKVVDGVLITGHMPAALTIFSLP